MGPGPSLEWRARVPSAGPNLRLWSCWNPGALEEEWALGTLQGFPFSQGRCQALRPLGRQNRVAPDQVMEKTLAPSWSS